MSTNFASHGEFSYHQEGRILVSTIRGPWNIELVKEFAIATDAHAKKLHATGPWGGISVFSESILSSPECLTYMRKIMTYGVPKYGLVAQAYVVEPSVAGSGLIEASYERVFAGLCPFRFFDDFASAKEWMLAQIEVANKA